MKRKNNFDKWFLLSWRKAWIIVVVGFVSIVLHNFWYPIFGFEEAVFFILVVLVIPAYFIITVVYTLIRKLKKKK